VSLDGATVSENESDPLALTLRAGKIDVVLEVTRSCPPLSAILVSD
jgi:hypothetical protein